MSDLEKTYGQTDDPEQRRAACVDAVLEVITASAAGGNKGAMEMLNDISQWTDAVQRAVEKTDT